MKRKCISLPKYIHKLNFSGKICFDLKAPKNSEYQVKNVLILENKLNQQWGSIVKSNCWSLYYPSRWKTNPPMKLWFHDYIFQPMEHKLLWFTNRLVGKQNSFISPAFSSSSDLPINLISNAYQGFSAGRELTCIPLIADTRLILRLYLDRNGQVSEHDWDMKHKPNKVMFGSGL